ncbi:amino acid permease [Acidipropionibacterium jensenii]|uniref:amino acid permease n=1 Tax=Acidipropionibacterium jensenii TaxID=1749 RepID=UPI002649C0A4|nr:amino acid permease [Acidipropionibacterium jensenii]MDN6623812.1 amino acid permease [Acidipropionibacterium jensenii]MDN6791924.1 amino acid permease [Acidipropionibacterium jensenii]
MRTPTAQELFRRRLPAGVSDEGCPEGIAQTPERIDESHSLRRSMSTLQLTLIGVGGTVGTGIFFILSQAVPEAGPAVLISFVLAAVVAGLTVVCYAELASTMPSSGSSYSFTYATMGELVAFIVGACLILEYGVSAAAVAVGWSEYLNLLMHNLLGFSFPAILSAAPDAGGLVNLPAVILVGMCLLLLLRGASESARANSIMVIVKMVVLVIFAAIAFTGFHADHFSNFAPYGAHGVTMATGSLFFSYIGLDAVATTGGEVHNPRKAVPRALILALIIVTAIYLLVAVSALGAQPASAFSDQTASLAHIVEGVVGSSWPGTVLAVGAVISIFSVTLICLYGQTRILYSMSRDGMVPAKLSEVHPRTRVPVLNSWIVCLAVAVLAGFLPLGILADLTSIGTLSAFALVSLGVIILRRTAPDLPRGFKVPGYPVTPILSIIACIYVVSGLHALTLMAFGVWIAIALVFYFTWSRRHSELAAPPRDLR